MVVFLLCQMVVSYSISTSNHNLFLLVFFLFLVVSYSISTSNHNIKAQQTSPRLVVSYSISTSNHNSIGSWNKGKALFLIRFLHQTTTQRTGSGDCRALFLIRFLHQTTTSSLWGIPFLSCFLFDFYIKPQHSLSTLP